MSVYYAMNNDLCETMLVIYIITNHVNIVVKDSV